MADSLSIASSVIALVAFAFKFSTVLYTTNRDFQSQNKNLRALKNELSDLRGVLESLADTVDNNSNVSFDALKLPLLRCGKLRGWLSGWSSLTPHRQEPDPRVVSGLLAVVTATIQSSKVLYQTVQSFRDHPRSVRQLRDELDALAGVLHCLEDSARCEPSILIPLKLPLERCTEACADFRKLIVRCTKHSGEEGTTSFRDWARLRYMDNDINGFTAMLAGYKATIAIALADANLRSSTVTLHVLNEYKDMIRDTKQDLEAHLEEVTVKLQSLTRDSKGSPRQQPADIERFRNERETTEQCLEICSQVLSHINGLRLLPVAKGEAASGITSVGLSTQDLTRAHIMTLSTLKDCCDQLSDTLGRLRALEEDTKGRLQTVEVALEQNTSPAQEIRNETQSLAREFDSVRQCLSICSNASVWVNSGKVHTLQDITIGKDGKQMLIATLGELFDARRVQLGQGAMQVVASSSDASLQELFRAQSRR